MAVLLWGSVDEERCWGAGRGPRDEEEMESKGRNGAAGGIDAPACFSGPVLM